MRSLILTLALALAAAFSIACQQKAAPSPVPVAMPKPETVFTVKTAVGEVAVVQPDGWLGKVIKGDGEASQVDFNHERLGLNLSVLLGTITPGHGLWATDVCSLALLTMTSAGSYEAVESVPIKGAAACRIEGRTKESRAFVASAPVKGTENVVITVGGRLPLTSDWASVNTAIEAILDKTVKK
jgi:hypothetical protein